MKKWIFIVACLFLVACSNNETVVVESETIEPQNLREKLEELTEMYGEDEVEHSDIDQAIHEAEELGLQGEERDFFVRSYLIALSAGKEPNVKSIQEDSKLRMLYESAWQELAYEKYGISVEEEQFEDFVNTYLEHLNKVLDMEAEIQGIDFNYLAEALDYSLEQFFYTFEKHNFEKWLIGEQLFPILKEEYELDDNIEISNQYRIEVIDYIVESES